MIRKTGATKADSLTALFGGEPIELTSLPTTPGLRQNPAAEGTTQKSHLLSYGWVEDPYQTKGMYTLWVDQVNQMPEAGVQGAVRSTIQQSHYAPENHRRNAFWMFDGWDPIYRFANTDLDVRFTVAKPQPLTNATPGNLPYGARQVPIHPFYVAWRVPRFSSEPATIVPQST